MAEIFDLIMGSILGLLTRMRAFISKKVVEKESTKLEIDIKDINNINIFKKERSHHPTFGSMRILCENHSVVDFHIKRIAVCLSVFGKNMPIRDRRSDYPILRVSEDCNILSKENIGHIYVTSTKINSINSKGNNFTNILIEFEIPPWINVDDISYFFLDGFIELQKGVVKPLSLKGQFVNT